MDTSTTVFDQRANQIQYVTGLAPPALAVRGSDGTLTAPQVFTTPSPTDGDLTQRPGHGVTSYRKAREIRRDPTVKMVREMAMAPLLMAEWEYEETESAPAGARELIKEVMERLKLPLMKTSLCGMCDYGWQPYELVADQSPDGFTWPVLKPLLQDITTILVDAADGSFFGLKQNAMYGQRNGFVYLLEGECIVVSQDVEGTDWYGESTLKALEKTYDADEQVAKNSRKYDAKVSGTHWVIYYPLGTSKMDSETLDNAVIARRLLLNAEAVGGMIVPRSVIQSLDTLSAQQANDESSQWKIELLSDQGKGQQPFTDRQKYLDVLKVRAFGFPERAVLEGQFGTKAEAEAHADMAVNNMEARHALLVSEHYNPKIVDWVLTKNYGPEAIGSVRIKPTRLADADKVMFRELYTLLLSDPAALQREVAEVDIHQVRDRLNIPEAAAPVAQYADADYGLPAGFEQPDLLNYDQAPTFTPIDEIAMDWQSQPRVDAGSSDGGEWEAEKNITKRKKAKTPESDQKSEFFKRHAAMQDAAAKKRNAGYAKLPSNDEGAKAAAVAHKSDGRKLYNTPTEDALTSVGNFQLKGRLHVGSGAEGVAKEMATYEHPDWPGISVNVNPDGSWNLFNVNTFSYTVGGTGPEDLSALLKRQPGEVLKMAWDDDAYDAETDPSDKQREAGNYRKGKLRMHGLDISIETPKGEKRKPEWPKLPAHYGYIRNTEGEDGDHLDCFVGKHKNADMAYVVYQNNKDGQFDEHKVMLGFKSKKKAVKAYSKAYDGRDPAKVVEVPVMKLAEWMTDEGVALAFDESKHPRDPGGEGGGQFVSKEAAHEYYSGKASEWANSLTKEERKALEEYKASWDYAAKNKLLDSAKINNSLRYNTVGVAEKKAIKHLDSLIAKSVLDEDTVVYHGSPDRIKHFNGNGGSVKKGDDFEWKSYMSTSTERNVAEAEGKKLNGDLMRIKLPKGSNAAYLDAIYHDNANEFLLPRGQKLKVTNITKNGKQRILDIEIVK